MIETVGRKIDAVKIVDEASIGKLVITLVISVCRCVLPGRLRHSGDFIRRTGHWSGMEASA